MRLLFLLYVLFAAATLQELSSRVGSFIGSARVVAQRKLSCLESAYKKSKKKLQETASHIISKWRGEEIKEYQDDEDDKSFGKDGDFNTEEFKEKIRKLIADLQAQHADRTVNLEDQANSEEAPQEGESKESGHEEKSRNNLL
ncbi:hypothetical protein PAEPH01_1212 [Pancytospora epiphaga]|nr:hypothetical protein PAEPH01_1212 [Pancytospora epiphaga]